MIQGQVTLLDLAYDVMIVQLNKRSLHFYVQKVENQTFMMQMVDM